MGTPLAVLAMLAALLFVVALELLDTPSGDPTDSERRRTWARTVAGVAVVLGTLALTVDWAAEQVDGVATRLRPQSTLDTFSAMLDPTHPRRRHAR